MKKLLVLVLLVVGGCVEATDHADESLVAHRGESPPTAAGGHAGTCGGFQLGGASGSPGTWITGTTGVAGMTGSGGAVETGAGGATGAGGMTGSGGAVETGAGGATATGAGGMIATSSQGGSTGAGGDGAPTSGCQIDQDCSTLQFCSKQPNFLFGVCADDVGRACTEFRDCVGSLRCVSGACAQPIPSDFNGSCTRTWDCWGNQLCYNGTCGDWGTQSETAVLCVYEYDCDGLGGPAGATCGFPGETTVKHCN